MWVPIISPKAGLRAKVDGVPLQVIGVYVSA